MSSSQFFIISYISTRYENYQYLTFWWKSLKSDELCISNCWFIKLWWVNRWPKYLSSPLESCFTFITTIIFTVYFCFMVFLTVLLHSLFFMFQLRIQRGWETAGIFGSAMFAATKAWGTAGNVNSVMEFSIQGMKIRNPKPK